MKKKLAFAMALILICACTFAACGSKKKPNSDPGVTGGAAETPVSQSVIPIAISETQYLFATNPDGSYETVVVTDAEGNTHTYLKGIKPGAGVVDDNAPGAETEMFEVENSRVVNAVIDILNSGNFQLEGYITTDGEKLPLSVYACGKNMRMGTAVSGVALEISMVDGNTWLIATKSKSYIELSDSIKKNLGFTEDDLTFDGFGTISKEDTVKSEATYNGKTVDCYTASSSDGDVKFYVDGENMVKIEMYDLTGICSTMIETTLIRGNVTIDDVKVPDGYSKKTYLSFISDIIGSIN